MDQDLLETLKLCYRKHHLNDPSIGWGELDEIMFNCLCETMGDREFQSWLEEIMEKMDEN